MNKSLRLRIGQGSGTEFSFGFVEDEMKMSLISTSQCRSTTMKSLNFSSPFLEKVCLKKKRKKVRSRNFCHQQQQKFVPAKHKNITNSQNNTPIKFFTTL